MGTIGIDYPSLSLQDALDLAVLIEEEARDRYLELAEQLEAHHTPGASVFFRRMVHVEEKHRKELEARRRSFFGTAAVRVTRAQLFDVEAPEYDVARAGMTVAAALQAALESEAKAHDFFAAALPQLKDPAVQALFAELREEEEQHGQWIRREMEKPAEADVPGDPSDEPVGQ
jgi:erythrin-vacuolar iron transport family protein